MLNQNDSLPLLQQARLQRAKNIAKNDVLPNLAPLLDVVFMLLVFFVLTYASSTQQFLQINLPTASTQEHKPTKDAINLLINADGAFFVDGQSYGSAESLKTALMTLREQGDAAIMISADARSDYQSFISAMDAASNAGFATIRLNTSQKMGETSSQ